MSSILLSRFDRYLLARANAHRKQYRPTTDIAILYINLFGHRTIDKNIDHFAAIGATDLFFS